MFSDDIINKYFVPFSSTQQSLCILNPEYGFKTLQELKDYLATQTNENTIETQEIVNEDGSKTVIETEKDSNGNVITKVETSYDSEGKVTSKTVTESTYDENGNETSRTEYKGR